MQLHHDIPQSQGAANALKRAKQMVCAQYVPLKPLPTLTKIFEAPDKMTFLRNYSMPGFPVQGIVYSSVRRVEKYVGFNISLETFFTAISNPNSVIYTRPIVQGKQGVHSYYGTVCSCFVSYVLQIPYKMRCTRLQQEPSLEKQTFSDLDELRLLDLLLDNKHVVIVTGIERDETGRIQFISVSESTMTFCRETRFTRDGFKAYWLDDPLHAYEFYRFKDLDRITYEPSPFVPLEGEKGEPKINRVLMPDFGNKANYLLGEPVELSVFDPGFDTVAVTDPDGAVKEYPVKDGKVVLTPEKPGFYSACCVSGGKKSDAVAWCVTNLTVTTDRTAYRAGEPVHVRYRNAAGDPLVAWQFNRTEGDRWGEGGYFTDKGSEGEFTVPMSSETGEVQLYLLARNAYGCYSSARLPIKVIEEEKKTEA